MVRPLDARQKREISTVPLVRGEQKEQSMSCSLRTKKVQERAMSVKEVTGEDGAKIRQL